MDIIVLSDRAWADEVAARWADRLAVNVDLRMCCPTGQTPVPLYTAMATLCDLGIADFGAATIVLLDEYLGLEPGASGRCDEMLRRHLVDRLRPAPAAVRTIGVGSLGPTDPDLEVEAAAIEAELVARPLDLALLGVGGNGHVGMNEPGSAPDSPTRIVELAASTRLAAASYGAEPVPTHGVTIGLRALLAAAEVWILATGSTKADVVAAIVDGPTTVEMPASLFRDHTNCTLFVDTAAWARRPPT
ncbi:MAG: 6-phosphogluconolactonase [Acidimicrobiales bacterium]